MLTFTISPHGERFVRDLQRDDFVVRPSADVFADHFSVDFEADDTMFVFVGSDSGLLVRWLAGLATGDGSRCLFVEPDSDHDAVAGQIEDILEPPDLHPHLQMCKALDIDATLATVELGRWLYGGKVVLVESMACYLSRCEAYTVLARSLRTLLGERAHQAALRLSGRKFQQVGIRNLTENRRPAACVGKIGTGLSAVVLGGGPSLDDHLRWVHANREQLFLFAVARIVGKLDDAGIVPDAVVAVDPHDVFYDISKHALALENTLLINSFHVVPQLLQQWPGPSVYIGQAMNWPNTLTDDANNIMSHGSTVTHAALGVAHHWGFSQILLSGFDLCYAPGGATHATGSLESLCAGLPISYDAQVTTYTGRRAGTALTLKLAREELERIGEMIARDGTCVYNLAAEAARVESIEHREPSEVTLQGTRPTIDLVNDSQEAEPHYRALQRELHRACRGMRALRAGCKKAQALLDGLHGSKGQPADPRCKAKLDALERHLDQRQEPWMNLIKGYAALEFMGTIAPRGFEVQTDEELESWGRNYYRIIDRAAKQLLEHLEGARERVKHRLLEVGPAPDATRLLDYWEAERTLGRIRFALHTSALDEGESARVANAERWLGEHLADSDTARARQLSAQKKDPKQLLRTVAMLFAEKERDDLALLAQAFDRHGEQYALIADWAFGQLAELDDDVPAALACYSAIVDRHATWQEQKTDVPTGQESLLEDALLRIARLQLVSSEPEDALVTLTLLSHLSIAYAPRRAKLLALLGRHAEAVALLQELLQGEMQDWRIAEQLADIYDTMNATDASGIARKMARQLRGTTSTGRKTLMQAA